MFGSFSTAPSTTPAASANGGNKLASYTFYSYARLYPSLQGRAANGLIYGAKSEMRTNFGSGTNPNGGVANSFASTWTTRRAYGYVGGDSWGIIRIGQGDGPLSIFTGGGITTGEAYSTGAWDGDVCTWVGAACLQWAFYDIGAEYVPNKITYISPSFSGLQVGVSFAPAHGPPTQAPSSIRNSAPCHEQLISDPSGVRYWSSFCASGIP